ncbi:MAG: hypothetical protein OXI71_10870 [Gemmatimonadota bacterium]|nr:hypothetical protein [Gemmatimonadota bacterium]MDE2678068.1 hypothetical protein [Gemmatimonadota bacterium]MXX33169.1 hypothetical protein [Gemmatimonadota bacterium]MYD12904.1 hypothetical protein [Gemmatimonadota bacterium]
MQPSNVISWLAVPGPQRRCGPLELAAALRRLHEAGMGRGYVLVVPTRLADQPMMEDGANAEVLWWARICDAVLAETPLGVVLIDTAGSGPDARLVRDRSGRHPGSGHREGHRARIKVFEDLSRPERSALMELSRALCTGHRGLLAEAGTLGVAAFEPWQLQVALRREAVGQLLDDPLVGVLPATA